MVKWIKAILASALSFLICFYTGKFLGFTGFSFAWVLNFVLMAWYTYIDSLFNWDYEFSYFDSQRFEKEGIIYKYLGVNLYRKLLVWTGWEKLRIKENKLRNSRSSLAHAEFKSRSSEAGHTLIFLIVGFVTFIVADSLKEALWLIILNLLLNAYPIFVQRYNRPRYKRLLRKISAEAV
ncbi:hypothetical protein HC174_05295 [Salinimicrobium sp. CDJ15-81-2]|nr:hypothetical protein [Salinimicrobium nanhaiense]